MSSEIIRSADPAAERTAGLLEIGCGWGRLARARGRLPHLEAVHERLRGPV